MAREDSIMPDVRLLAAISAGGGAGRAGSLWPAVGVPARSVGVRLGDADHQQGGRAGGDLGSAHYVST